MKSLLEICAQLKAVFPKARFSPPASEDELSHLRSVGDKPRPSTERQFH